MRIGELARRAGVNPRTVRYYEDIGLMPPARRTGGGYRDYGGADAERLGFIRAAQRLGLRLDEIAEALALREDDRRPCDYVRRTMRDHVADIDRRIAELRRLRRELVDLEARADRLTATPDTASASCPLIDHVRDRERSRNRT
ncbi:heavy metal-responsive transcriptional regulator [Nocardiopsis sp. FIRDI 009]|uniref:heavy metal-responsive transcriptional regulator n=1 Tax=Nocardiopsis sp. FIRDI 009 TaxID=714197 RepID=UPI000E2366B2|nr:heavy metal-responsive transcriptional regulator [Nocardiopsis sp. FIRDI 009]